MTQSLSRRSALRGLLLGATAVGLVGPQAHADEEMFEVMYSDAEWREKLTEMEYYVLREAGTERPFTSPLLNEKRDGLFVCKGCALPLYDSKTKYKSGTGWPSFWEAIDGAVGTRADWSFLMRRTELYCNRCGGHLGHVFNDGPPPTGKRHCINGVSLDFVPI